MMRISQIGVLFGLAQAQVKILAPNALVDVLEKHGNVLGTTATFGEPYYGEQVVGQLVYATPKSPGHCHEDDYDLTQFDDHSLPTDGEFANVDAFLKIVVVDRGVCTFVEKVRVAEKKHAHAVIVIDSDSTPPRTFWDLRHVIMADDGSPGDAVRIPSVMIPHDEGEKIKMYIQSSMNPVIAELSWDIPSNHITSFDVWMPPADLQMAKFLANFADAALAFEWNLDFTPHYDIFKIGGSDVSQMCLPGGSQICAAPGSGMVTGRDALEEATRELCIWKHTKIIDPAHGGGRTAHFSAEFWVYMRKVVEMCPETSPNADRSKVFGTKECGERAMGAAGLEMHERWDDIQHCIQTEESSLLTNEARYRAWSPTAIRVNGWRYSGTVEKDLIGRAICSGFIEKPQECADIEKPLDIITYQDDLIDGISGGELFMGIMIIILLFVAGMVCYKRVLTKYLKTSLREEVMLEVRTQMADYSQLKDGDDEFVRYPQQSNRF